MREAAMWWWILYPLGRRARARRRALAAAREWRQSERRQSDERTAAFERILAQARRDRAA
jgi:hypothetical protein